VISRCFHILLLFFIFLRCWNYFSVKSEVQCGHFTAPIAILLLQYGHSFSVGSAGASSGSLVNRSFIVLMPLINRKITNAVIKKLITAVIKLPYINTGASSPFPKVKVRYEKSIPPNKPNTGLKYPGLMKQR